MTDLPPLVVLRHGETEWNRAGRWQGHLDSPLTPEGEAQARAMGELLRDMGLGGPGWARRVSPTGRARRTAELLDLGHPFEEDPDLREIGVGAFAGHTRDEIRAESGLPDTAGFLEFYAAAPGGEGLEALWHRVGRVLDRLSGPTLIVTHGITSRFLRARALGLPIDRVLDVPGGQGVVHRVEGGSHATFTP